MESVHFSAGAPPAVGTHAVITRIDGLRWQAVEDDRVIGDGEASRRRDGRLFLSIDTWHGAVFDRLAAAMLADLPSPLYTMVDEADHDLTARWERAGLTVRRREIEYVVATDPLVVTDRYVGLVRVVARRRHARIGLVAVREGLRRRGIARALLAEVLGALHRDGIETASAEIDERNSPARALFEGIGAQRVSSAVEMVRGG